jgi:menaquinone reductase, molybdopterin-binding-like subunit
MLVRVVEGRAKKAEGNPDHPVNRGKLCARGQASVQEQYHPDRVIGPLQRGARSALSPISWEAALDVLAQQLRDLRSGGGQFALLTRPLRGHQALLARRFTESLGAEWHQLDLLAEAPLREASRRVFGQAWLPEFDVEHAHYVLSFGADFLSTWLSPVHYGNQYGVFRQGSYQPGQPRPRPRGHLVQVEPRFSMTAANADEWLPVLAGREGYVALSIAQVILSEGLGGTSRADPRMLEAFAPERVADATGVGPDRIRRLARDLTNRRPSLVLGGGLAGATTTGTEALTAILMLNVLLDNIGQPGGVRLNPPPPIDELSDLPLPSSFAKWQELAGRIGAGAFPIVLTHAANPVFELPGVGFDDALGRVSLMASLSSFLDETTARANLILPTHLPLEDWGDDWAEPGPGFPVYTIQQPVLQPFFDTRGFGDLMLQLAGRIGGEVQRTLPWRSTREMLREGARQVQQLERGSVQDTNFERFWVTLLQRGGWWDANQPSVSAPAAGLGPSTIQTLAATFPQAEAAGDPQAFPFQLLVFAHNSLGTGESAHLPWLQAAPDPMTSVVWQAWLEISPNHASQLRVSEGDLVRVESPRGQAELPVYVNPASAPGVVSVPLGQGHTAYGRWAAGRGANPLGLLAPLADKSTGSLAYAATRVRLVRTGRRIPLPKFEGSVPAFQVPDEQVLQVVHS